MEIKDYFIIILGVLGWIWAITQFILNRKYQKSDKALDKRFEVYSNFMNKVDEMSKSMRNDPKMTYGISSEIMTEILTGDEERTNRALIKFNQDLLEFTKSSLQPMMIMNQELNKLRLVASEKLLPKIDEYKILVDDFTDEFQTVLSKLSLSDSIDYTGEQLQSLNHEERGKKMGDLWKVIEKLMRDEIDYYKK
ncbi:hypothetical protein B0A67_12505 [Flavobacterium aquidurense]|uniref:hypothetical protein n=1 Tax=Flavobacterium aquidurense TaxID=362413 RepID=UPI00091CBD3E|nr:hypothetical protein [Flavobacterium aquidurense]OXA71089.1 hypothetical protein B0A67_12505 [Flavobacterium aquidurense]SHG63777.1 hypothetical protein SAMN05444481_10641 [Flavobacterium frigidimaris]